MPPSDWEHLERARGLRRVKIVGRHVIRRPLLLAALTGLFVLHDSVKDSFPLLAYGLTAPAGVLLITASMGRFRAPEDDDASGPAGSDGT
ncbi:hypothetical protein IAG44_30175 [Streptomyces roseirectus]|uniref:Uncharacterized protein n=1 Tax=Streptomyces roseirectus TaxID=2768066 RepID=A0A7H0IKH4_9ACTN|nr:hypothetical protein [Streptomyces roseirectus]QNP73290.1 hypothetical protein IAG44_30175 [Streptomyces roseirectus]